MKILLDGRMLYYSGIGRYLRTLVLSLLRNDETIAVTLAGNVSEIEQFQLEWTGDPNRLTALQFDAGVYSPRETLAVSFWKKASAQHDVVHFPHYNVPMFIPRNSVTTIHDVIQFTTLKHEYSAAKLLIARQALRRALGARQVLAVSNLTKQYLVDGFGADIHRVNVLYPLLSDGYYQRDEDTVAALRRTFGLRGKYLLFVGSMKDHKNSRTLFRAFSELVEEEPELLLVVVGSSLEKTAIVQEYGSSEAFSSNLFVLSNLSDDEFSALYSGAEALVAPSLEEGYGYPPLEALACGTMPVVSDIPIFHETLDGRAVFFPPLSSDGLIEAIKSALRQPRPSGITAADLSAAESDFARNLINIYRKVAQKPS